MKRIVALAAAAAILCSVPGCAGRGKLPSAATESIGATLTVELTNSCKSVPLTKDSEFQNGNYVVCGNDIVLQGYGDDFCIVIGLYDLNTGEIKKTVVENTENDRYLNPEGFYFKDGILTILIKSISKTDYSGGQYFFYRYDETMTFLNAEPVTEIWTEGKDVTSWRCLPDGTQVISTSNGCYLEDANGVQKFSEEESAEIIVSPDSTIWIVSINGNASRLDRSTMTVEKLEMDGIELPQAHMNNGGYYDGFGEYPILCTNKDGLYGLKPDTNEMVELVNFANSDLVEANRFSPLPDGRFLGQAFDYLSLCFDTYILTPRTQEEVDNIRTITMAALCYDQQTKSRIARFNQQSENYKIVLKSYMDLDDINLDYDACLEAYHADLLKGIVPDIMLIESDYQMLSNKGLFEDLRPWMENDPDFHQEEYMINVFEARSYKGHLERIPFDFFVNCFVAKKKYIGDSTNLSAAQLSALELPDEMTYFQNTSGKTAAFMDIFKQATERFVDYENGTCSFDSDVFLQLVELMEWVPDKTISNDDYCYIEDRALLSSHYIGSLDNYNMFQEALFGDEEITICGIESNGGSINSQYEVAISAQSKEKEAAWEFIKFNLQEEQQYFNESSFTKFPVNRKALQNMLKDQIKPHDEHHTTSLQMNGEEIIYGAATQEEMEILQNYLNSLSNQIIDDTKIMAIVEEEISKHFAGDCASEDAAQRIQSRVMLYLSEQS